MSGGIDIWIGVDYLDMDNEVLRCLVICYFDKVYFIWDSLCFFRLFFV